MALPRRPKSPVKKTKHHSQQWKGSEQCDHQVTSRAGIKELFKSVNRRYYRASEAEVERRVSFVEKYSYLFIDALSRENFELLLEMIKTAHAEYRETNVVKHRSELMDMPLELTSISARTLLWLEREGIREVGHLLGRSREQLMAIPQFGPSCLQECIRAVEELGFTKENKHASDSAPEETRVDPYEGSSEKYHYDRHQGD